jgi:hypothetical protein
MKKEKTYLYLAKRDKKGFELISSFQGDSVDRTRIHNIDELHLPISLSNAIKKTVYDNRFQWELWIESAESFHVLKEKLTKRGYKNVPSHAIPKHPVVLKTVVNSPEELKNIIPDIRANLKKKTMIRKAKFF